MTDGRFEIFLNGQWGTVCDDLFDLNTYGAQVACRMLGQPTGSARVTDPLAGPNTMPIWLDDVVCKVSELTLLECDHRLIGYHSCTQPEDVGLYCA
ncbi:hypothetical protein DPMN_029435 [Dreissena polymorpha]|uniref:SRCR domain-containing protein n=2 Tax=Dreissena polymorpha TaxID=45954 RepID=A0A9D4RH50_DREPO|nr:hypothetical protein DPMN_029435 [Dreissena polymorpha]